MDKRTLVPLASLAAAALLILTACGGGGESHEEKKITETIEKAATTSDPGNCTKLETQRFVEQNAAEKGKTALETCEREATEGEDEAKSVAVSDISVNGSDATAVAEFEGGSLDSQAIEVELVEEGGAWKLDYVEGFASYDGKALGKQFERQFEEEPGDLDHEQAKCIAAKIASASQAEAEELFFAGSPAKIIQLAKSCA